MKWKKYLCIALTVCLCIPGIFFIPSYMISPNAYEIPSCNLQTLTNRDFQNAINNSLSRHIPGKNLFRRAKTQLDIWMGKQESDNIYICNTMLIEKNQLPDTKTADHILQKINDFSAVHSRPVYLMLIPASIEINKDKLPAYAPSDDESAFIESCYAKLSKNVTSLDAVTALSSAKNAQMYYRTDNRLTSLGAYNIYNYTMKNMGFLPATSQDFNVQYATKDFYGSLYQQILPPGIQPDRVDLYHYNENKTEITVTKPSSHPQSQTAEDVHHELYYRDYLNSDDSMLVFLGKSCPVTKIQTNSNTGKKLLVFGDENIGTFSQFLILHFDEIDIVNLNSFKEEDASLIQAENYDTILFEYMTSSLSDSDLFSKLSSIH